MFLSDCVYCVDVLFANRMLFISWHPDVRQLSVLNGNMRTVLSSDFFEQKFFGMFANCR
jgi:hypothetical protein